MNKLNIASLADYQHYYKQSITQPDLFWNDIANAYIDWFEPWSQIKSSDLNDKNAQFEWFKNAKLNVSYNCLDRHLKDKANHIALIWEGDDPKQSQVFTYQEIYQAVCQFANVLKSLNIKKGDRVCIYLPMIPQAMFAMLACARIGAIHSVVFAGFSSESLQTRINDADCTLLITADEGIRGGKTISLKINADKALEKCPRVQHLLMVKRTGADVPWNKNKDVAYEEIVKKVSNDCPPTIMDAEDPLFILYTSGSTGKPKGVCHTTAGYIVYAALTHHVVFNYQVGDIYWCTADVGWITGHSYIVYGPLANGATTVMFEGVPSYPDFSRFWQIVDKYKINIFYTAPTAIRALMREGDEYVKKGHRQSLKLLGTVGEPINPDVWHWYHQIVGDGRCPIVDTWWQTETGGIMLTPLPGITPLKPGSASWPFFGVAPALVNDQGVELTGPVQGQLIIKQLWPGIMRTVYGDHQRFIQTYLTQFPGNYLTGDGARRDEENYYWITGRIDDVINVSGHRMGTAEIESALLTHPHIAEAAVVPITHPIKGQAIYAFVTTRVEFQPTEDLKKQLLETVRHEIGSIAIPEIIQFATALPKTRSGKIMRRILRKIASNEIDNLGDTSTLADPSVVEVLIEDRKRLMM